MRPHDLRHHAATVKWSPPSDETFHQFLGRLDSTGGFAVVETDNPDSLAEAPSKFGLSGLRNDPGERHHRDHAPAR